MVLIIDENRNVIENLGTNSMFPDGDIPGLPKLPQGHVYIKIKDNSPLAEKLISAYDFSTVWNGSEFVDITIIKTHEQYREEQPKEEKKPTFEERLIAVENEIKSLKKG